ncbi:hypothetical protein [uncultured Ottowia sp.]|uniref:hypothetical protein n=1 Tax=uncultured Ottowia sp. TaxID=543067 RepID=UPI0025970F06|nr:hypothetical protein [uncultured Ottowia sp.]
MIDAPLTNQALSAMRTTAQLLEHALKTRPAQFWCDRYYLNKSALSIAKKRGHLSPVLAGNLAYDLGEDVTKWMAIAATETERDTPMSERLRELLLDRNP